MTPSKTYIALLDIKAVIRQWQDNEISDDNTIVRIAVIVNQFQTK